MNEEHVTAPHAPLSSGHLVMLGDGHHAALPPGRGSRFARIFWVVVVSIIAALIVFGVALYQFKYQAPWVKSAVRVVPAPFGIVGYHPLFMSEYFGDVEALAHFYRQQDQTLVPVPSEADVRLIARENVVRRALLNDLARQYGIWVTSAEVEQTMNEVVGEAQSREQVAQNIKSLWGWSIDEFKQKVLRPYVIRERLLEVLQQDPVISRELGGTTPQALDAYLDVQASTRAHFWYDVTMLE